MRPGWVASSFNQWAVGVILVTVLVPGHDQGEQIVADPEEIGLDAGVLVGPHGRGDADGPGHHVDALLVLLPVAVRDRQAEQHLAVGAGAVSDLVGQVGQVALVLHLEQDLGRSVGMRRDDDLLGGVALVVEVEATLHPAWVPGQHLVPAVWQRVDLVHLMQLVHLGAQGLGQIQVVGVQLVLRIATAANHAASATRAADAARAFAAEVGIVRFHAGFAKVDPDRSSIERGAAVTLPGLTQHPIGVGHHERDLLHAEHALGLVNVRGQFVSPVGDVGPLLGFEERPGRHVQGLGIDVRTPAHASTTQQQHVVEHFHALDAVHLCCREPHEILQMPVRHGHCAVRDAPP